MIKAIETEYNGYLFRSRVEARWAVFFDTLGIRYEYEEDVYNIDGTWYLPDFHLPEQKCWFEVKGDEQGIKNNHDLYQGFAGKIGPLVAFTTPSIDTVGTKFIICAHDSNAGYSTNDVSWYFCPTSGFQLSLRCSYRCTVWTGNWEDPVKVCSSCDVNSNSTCHDFVHPWIIDAYRAARQARFEHHL